MCRKIFGHTFGSFGKYLVAVLWCAAYHLHHTVDILERDINEVLHLNGIEKESDVSDNSHTQTESTNRQDIEDIQDKVSSLSKSMDEITTRIGEIDRLLGIVSPDESETVYRLVPEHKVAFAPAVSTKEDGTSKIVYNTKLDKNRILSDIVAHLLEDAKIELVDPTENDSLVKRRFGKSIHIGSKTKK